MNEKTKYLTQFVYKKNKRAVFTLNSAIFVL